MKKIYSLFNLKTGVFLLLATLFGINANATVWPIPNGDADTLEHFIENTSLWGSGDTILVTDIGPYIMKGTIDIFQEVTIMGDTSLASNPELRFYDNGFRPKKDSISLYFSHLKLNGLKEDNSSKANFFFRYDQYDADAMWYDLVFEDIEAYNFVGGIQFSKNIWLAYENVVFDNCLFHDIGGSGSIYFLEPRKGALKNMSVTNSTFYNISTTFMRPTYFSDGTRDTIQQNLKFEHNTFWKIVGAGYRFFQINDPKDSATHVLFQNNIVSTLIDTSSSQPFLLDPSAGDFKFNYNTFHFFESNAGGKIYNLDSVAANQTNVTAMNNSTDYPGFADTNNADFSLYYGSPLLTAGSDGGPIGDLRWIPEEKPWNPGPNCHLIPNSAPDTLEHFIENYYNVIWHNGDTIMLVSGGEYIVAGTVDLFGEVSIMGDPRLSVKPTVRFYDNGFRPKKDSINLYFSHMKLNGLKADNSSKANFFFRYDQYDADAMWYELVFEDIEAYNFVGGIQFSKNIWLAYENVVINNCLFHDIGGSGSIYFLEPRKGALKNMSVTNSTFYNISTTFMRPTYFSDGTRDTIQQNLKFEHNTFWKIVGAGYRFFQINDPKDSATHVLFQNNIVSTLIDTSSSQPFLLDPSAGEFAFNNNTFHFFKSNASGGIYNLDSVSFKQTNVTAENVFEFYPGFADSTNGNFMLSDTSSLLMAGTDGGPIGDPRWVPVAGVTIDALTEAVVEGIDATMTATVNISGTDKTVTWSVTNGTGTATIGAGTGVLSPLTPGTVTVKATSNYNAALYDELVITIEAKVDVTSIALEGKNSSGEVTDQLINYPAFLNISATVSPGNATDKSLTWSISAESDGKATLEVLTANTAKLNAVQCGTVYVVAAANDGSGVKDSLKVTLTKQTQVDSIHVNGTGGASEISTDNGTLQMDYTIYPDTACIKDVTWSVDDENVATISSGGLLTAVNNGTVVVTARATDGSYKTGKATITVSNQVVSIRNAAISDLMVTPNPAVNFIVVKSEATADVTINNIVGTVVLSAQVQPDEQIDISSLKAGVYIVNVKAGRNYTTVRLIKK